MLNTGIQDYQNIREYIQDFYTIYPSIKSQIAQILLQDNNVNHAENPLVDIEAIAKRIGISAILPAPPEVVGNEHSLLIRDNIILLNNKDSQEVRRFSIAREVAHLVNGDISKNMPYIAKAIDKQWESMNKKLASDREFDIRRIKSAIHEEMEAVVDKEIAGYFAANLLVPTKRFILWKDKPDEEIARAFAVSVACIQKRRSEIEHEISLTDMMKREIKISRGNVVGIGKVKIPKTQEFNHEIQLLSFLDIRESETSFISTCIHLRIDGYGKTIEEAEEDMVENIYYFLCENFTILSIEDAWKNLSNLYKSDEWTNALWDAYHEFQIQLSINGIPTDNTAALLNRLKQLEERIKELETQVKNEEQEKDRIGLSRDIRKLARDFIVDKTYWEAAA